MNVHLMVSFLLRRGLAGTLLLGTAAGGAFADVVIDWNVSMTSYSESLPPPGMPPYIEARIYAMTHVAMFNAIDEANGLHSHHWKHHDPANAEAASAQAAHDVLVNQFPDGTAAFDALLATQLSAIPNGPAKANGIGIGADSAAEMLAARFNDGAATAEGPYTPGPNPGDYQFTPPFDGPPFNGYAAVPKWGSVTPFVLENGRQFRASPPYQVTDLDYTFDLNEIKALGSIGSAGRSEDQTDVALFWYENSSFGWNRVARLLAAQHPGSLLSEARLFAALNAAMFDATVASFDSKYTYNFWRPITAIQKAETDGNDLTTADPTWQPLFLTPPIPDYPSNHAAMGGAASTVLAWYFGGDQQTFTLPSTMSLPFPQIQPRTFHRISDAAKENAISRMLVGIHFRLACEKGLELGVEVGTWVVNHAPYAKGH
jgi:hypothetical protein